MKSLHRLLLAALMVLSFSVAGFAQTSTGGQMGGGQAVEGSADAGEGEPPILPGPDSAADEEERRRSAEGP